MTPLPWNEGPALLLVLARVGGALSVAPIFGAAVLPKSAKAAMALVLAMAVLPAAPPPPALSGLAVAGAVVTETAVGLLLGFAASMLFHAVRTAGAIVDQELGLSMASVLDPATGEPVAVVGQLKLALAGAAFLLVDGHHLLLSGIADSFRTLPPGGALSAGSAGTWVASWGTALLVFAVKTAMPALAAAFAVTLAAGFLTRALPGDGTFVTALPLRLATGLVVLAAGTSAFVYGFAAEVRGGEDSIRDVLRAVGGRP